MGNQSAECGKWEILTCSKSSHSASCLGSVVNSFSETSSVCSELKFPNSVGSFRNRLLFSHSVSRDSHSPISGGMDFSRLLER